MKCDVKIGQIFVNSSGERIMRICGSQYQYNSMVIVLGKPRWEEYSNTTKVNTVETEAMISHARKIFACLFETNWNEI
jgi:preprotein translocase subunit Sss1